MATENKTTKKATTGKVVAVKPAAPAKTAVAKKLVISQERFDAMISVAAYFAALNDGYKKDSIAYWLETEAALRPNFDIE